MFFHASYAPFRVGDAIVTTETAPVEYRGKRGKVTRISPPDAFDGEEAVYYVQFEFESEECPQSFGYWQLGLQAE